MTSADLQANEIARLQFEYLWDKKLQTYIKYRFTSCLRKRLGNYRIAGKFGGELNLAVWRSTFATAKLKCANISYLHIYMWRSRTEPPNLNPPIFFAIAIWGPTAKFNSRQYFRLYGIQRVSS